MKPNIFLSAISLALAGLIGYLAYNIAEGKDNDAVCGVFSSVCFIATLLPIVGIQYESGRLGINIRIMSFLFFLLFLISHFCFAWFGIQMPYYAISNGMLLLLFLAIFYKMININKL